VAGFPPAPDTTDEQGGGNRQRQHHRSASARSSFSVSATGSERQTLDRLQIRIPVQVAHCRSWKRAPDHHALASDISSERPRRVLLAYDRLQDLATLPAVQKHSFRYDYRHETPAAQKQPFRFLYRNGRRPHHPYTAPIDVDNTELFLRHRRSYNQLHSRELRTTSRRRL
jgi:hypothetical protein